MKVIPLIGTTEKQCPSCGGTNGEALSQQRVEEGLAAGVFQHRPKEREAREKGTSLATRCVMSCNCRSSLMKVSSPLFSVQHHSSSSSTSINESASQGGSADNGSFCTAVIEVSMLARCFGRRKHDVYNAPTHGVQKVITTVFLQSLQLRHTECGPEVKHSAAAVSRARPAASQIS